MFKIQNLIKQFEINLGSLFNWLKNQQHRQQHRSYDIFVFTIIWYFIIIVIIIYYYHYYYYYYYYYPVVMVEI